MDAATLHWLEIARARFRHSKILGERALEQLDDEQLFAAPAEGLNSAAAIVTHVAGNQLSRWTDFMTTDGEKAFREREKEFDPDPMPRDELMERWEKGWRAVFNALDGVGAEDLLRPVTIRGEVHTVIAAVERQLGHYAYHVGQLVTTARLLAGDAWEWLSIPPGGSDRFNESKGYRPEG
jgi:hypothetical protein